MIKLNFSNFFDRQAIIDKLDAASIKVLSKFGAWVRRSGKQRIRKRKAPAKPGQSPSSHTGLLKDFLFFFYDPSTKSVVAGPMLLNTKQRGTVPAPSLLEFGGVTTLFYKPGSHKSGASVRQYHAYPYMKPAMDENLPKFAGLFANTVS